VTEIPEHLLKRSRERRSAIGGEAGDTPAAAPATTAPTAAPAVQAAAAPAPVTPKVEAPKPVPAYLAAAQSRKKIPIWAMPVLAALPLWAFLYVNAMTRQPKKVTGPLAEGAQVYSVCSSCHGSAGGGGAGRKLSEGEVLRTFPNIEDQIRFVYNGSRAYDGKVFGDPNRVGGPHIAGAASGYPTGGMPMQGAAAGGALTDAEILAVICDERYTLSGADPLGKYVKEYTDYCGFVGAKIPTDPATPYAGVPGT
jgi:mono/diheme cytochrome c family protein